MGVLRPLNFHFGFATNWCVILGKVFDITELLFLHLETNEGDLWGLPVQVSHSLTHDLWPMLCLTYSKGLMNRVDNNSGEVCYTFDKDNVIWSAFSHFYFLNMPLSLTFLILRVNTVSCLRILMLLLLKFPPSSANVSFYFNLLLWSLLLLFDHCVWSDSLHPYGVQHTRLSCPSPSPRVCANSCPLSQWCPPTVSSSLTRFSCYSQPFLTSVFSSELIFHIRWPKNRSFSFSFFILIFNFLMSFFYVW